MIASGWVGAIIPTRGASQTDWSKRMTTATGNFERRQTWTRNKAPGLPVGRWHGRRESPPLTRQAGGAEQTHAAPAPCHAGSRPAVQRTAFLRYCLTSET